MATRAYIGLGSNCGDTHANLEQAVTRIASLPDVAIVHVSSLYLTEPQGFADQPWFANQVAALDLGASWTPQALLGEFLRIENELGRERNPNCRFGPRTMDIDLLLFGEAKSEDPYCTLPHPRMLERAFVLVPLCEIAPNLSVSGVGIGSLLENIKYSIKNNRIYQ